MKMVKCEPMVSRIVGVAKDIGSNGGNHVMKRYHTALMLVFCLFAALAITTPTVAQVAGVVAPDNLVVRLGFEGDFTNTASGLASAGATGDGTDSGPITFGASLNALGGQSSKWGVGFDDITFNDAAFVDLFGTTGMTISMFVESSGVAPSAPAWFFNFQGGSGGSGSTGVRINPNTTEYRVASYGGFHGGGAASSSGYDHIAQVILPSGVAAFYLNGVLNDGSGAGTYNSSITNAIIGAWTLGGEWRLDNYDIDEVRVYNTALSSGDVATLATQSTIPEPGTAALLLIALTGLIIRGRR